MYEAFTEDARQVMQRANEEAQRSEHEYIGTEHILLAMLKVTSSGGARILKQMNFDLQEIRLKVEQTIPSEPGGDTTEPFRPTPRAKKVIEYAIEEARRLRHQWIGSEHVLLGLFREEQGVAGIVLRELGLELEDLRRKVREYCIDDLLSRREPVSLSSLSEEVQEKVRQLDLQVQALNREEEEAVAASDFMKAARLRDRCDQLSKQRWNLMQKDQDSEKAPPEDERIVVGQRATHPSSAAAFPDVATGDGVVGISNSPIFL